MSLAASPLALLDTLTFPETLAIIVIALVVLGPEKLPAVARQVGVWMQTVRRVANSLQSEVREVLDDPAMQPLKELGEFAAQPRQKIADYVRGATELDPTPDPTPDPLPDPTPEVEDPQAAPGPVRIVASGLEHPMEALSLPEAALSTAVDGVDPMFAPADSVSASLVIEPSAEDPGPDVPPSFS